MDSSLFSNDDANRLSLLLATRREGEGVKNLSCFFLCVDKLPRDYAGHLSRYSARGMK